MNPFKLLMPWNWFGPNDKKVDEVENKKLEETEKDIRRQLSELHHAIKRRPDRVNDLERAFQKCLVIIKKYRWDLKDKTHIKVQMVLIEEEIKKTREKNRVAKNKKTS